MSEELSGYYKDLKARSQKKRASNRKNSIELLIDAEIIFEVKNHGAHLIVEAKDHLVDLWPGTGRWIPRCRKGGRGIKSLIKYVKGTFDEDISTRT